MPRGKKLTEEDIGRLASAEIQAATSYDGTDYQKDRVRALEYYRGEMNDLENEEGTSEAVTHDVADTIGWMLPGLMRVFFSGPSLGVYEPENEEDEQAAIQATNYANYVIMKECQGYTVFWDVFHDALYGGLLSRFEFGNRINFCKVLVAGGEVPEKVPHGSDAHLLETAQSGNSRSHYLKKRCVRGYLKH